MKNISINLDKISFLKMLQKTQQLFSNVQNLHFAADFEFVQQVVALLTWGQNVCLMAKKESTKECLCYTSKSYKKQHLVGFLKRGELIHG